MEKIPISSPSAQSDAWLGSMSNTLEIIGDIVSPVMEEGDWEALRE